MERGAAPAGWARNPTLGLLRASCRAALRPLREVLARREPSSAFRRLERDHREERDCRKGQREQRGGAPKPGPELRRR